MIKEADSLDILQVALNMRESDYREFSAVYACRDREELAVKMAQRYKGSRDLICAKNSDGDAIAVGAAFETRPNVVTVLFFATDKLPQVGLSVTRFIKKNLLPKLKEAGVHRIECVSIENYDAAHRWIMSFGLTPETEPLRGYGKNGERFIQFSWVRDDLR